MDTFPTLNTDRLALRQMTIADRNELLKLRMDEQVNKYLGRPATTTLAEAEAFIDKITEFLKGGQSAYWAISLKSDPALIGTICYWNLIPEKQMAEIGYELLPGHQGKGLMQEAITAAINYGQDVMQLKIIAAQTHPDNLSSIKLLEKVGFKLDADHEYVSEADVDEGLAVYVLNL